MSKLTLVPKVAAQGILGVVIFVIWITVYLFFIGAFITGGLYVYNHVTNHFHHAANTVPANQPYIAIKDNFKIQFPSAPTPTNSSTNLAGVNVPYTTYQVQSNNSNTLYAVAVYNLPTNNPNFPISTTTEQKSFLQQWVNGTPNTSNGVTTSLLSSSFINFKGYSTTSSHYLDTGDGETLNTYQYAFLRGTALYVIITVGVPQSTFSTFANSFQSIN
jgi:hypothetical protein